MANAHAPARVALLCPPPCKVAAEIPEATGSGFPWKSATTEFTNPTGRASRPAIRAGSTKKSLPVHSVLEACGARGIAVIGTPNEGALHAELKDWYRRRGDRVEQLVDGFVVDLVRGELLVEIQTGSFAPLRRKLE